MAVLHSSENPKEMELVGGTATWGFLQCVLKVCVCPLKDQASLVSETLKYLLTKWFIENIINV